MHPALDLTGGFANLVAALRTTADRRGGDPALSWLAADDSVATLPWAAYRDRAARTAGALRAVGVRPGDRVGILSENRADWLVTDLGILAAGAVTVAPHAPLTARQVQFQLHDAEVGWLFVSGPEQFAKIDQMRGELPHLRGVVAFDPAAVRGDVEGLDRFLGRGSGGSAVLDEVAATLRPDDLAGILYTSGTTGNPKGVMLTQHNILSNSWAMIVMCPPAPDDLHLSWLPYTHIYARTCDHYKALLSGLHLFLAPNGDAVPALLPRVQPTHLSSVPRLYEKILAAVSGGGDAETANRLQALFGPRRKWCSSGGAPLPPAIAEMYRRCGVLVLQGYGLTESSPVISFNQPEAYKLDTVGRAIPGVEIRIADDGEILTRGPHVMKGYWKNPSATAAMVRDGWLYTGDLGSLDADGYLKITGRKKEMMVLSNGKKVAPTEIEGLLIADGYVEQVVVCGEGRSFLTALVVPLWPAVRRELALDGTSEELAGHPAVVRLLTDRIASALRDVSPAEQVRKFVVLAEPFSVAKEELTVSLKLRREVILRHNAARLAALYEGAAESCS